MKIKHLILTLFAIMLCTACKNDEGYISITNKVSNVGIENISFGDISMGQIKLLPGETSKKFTISEDVYDIKLPLTGQFKFYMVSGDKKILLWTKAAHELKAGQHLNIVIDNETEIINPLNTKESISLSAFSGIQ